MSTTRERTALAAVGQDGHDDASALLGAAAHHGGEKSPHRDGGVPLRDLLGDQVLDLLLERSCDGAGGLRLTGQGSMLGELVKAVLERALETELSAHLGYGKHEADFTTSTWGQRYPQAARVFETAWDRFVPFFAFSPAVRKLLYTTNGIESLNYQLRKVTKARGHFPGDDAVVKLLWLAIINIEDKRARERTMHKEKTGKIKNSPSTARLIEGQRTIGWREALIELDIAYPGRIK
jgi:hypothetical protein